MSDTTTPEAEVIAEIDKLEAALAPEAPAAKVVPNDPPKKAPAKKAPAKPAAKKAPASKTVAKVDKPVEGEVVEKPLSATAAKVLDKKIKSTAGQARDVLTDLTTLLAEAEKGQIHLALGMRSWTEYMSSLRLPVLGKEATAEAIEMMHEAGMPQRAISESTGVPLTTVNRKVKEAEAKAEESGTPKAPATSVGKDGKEYQRQTDARTKGAAKSSATKKKKADTGRASGKPISPRALTMGEAATYLEKTHYASFSEGEINNIRRIAKAAEKVLREWDLNATNNKTAKA